MFTHLRKESSQGTFVVSLFLLFLTKPVFAREIQINQLTFFHPPPWVNAQLLQTTVDKVQNFLEWDLRKLSVFYYTNEADFNRQHVFKFSVDAFFKKSDQSIHLSNRVNEKNFKQIFSHELVHAVFSQKYKKAIPVWLEEGLANTLAGYPPPNYQWLEKQTWPLVSQLGHVTNESLDSKVYYSVSTGVIEMIKEKCNLHELLKLAVGSQFTSYLKTFCQIDNLDLDLKTWVKGKAQAPPSSAPASQDLPWWKKRKN